MIGKQVSANKPNGLKMACFLCARNLGLKSKRPPSKYAKKLVMRKGG